MVRFENIRGPLTAGLLWAVVALGMIQLRDQGHAILLIWLPSAVSVASLYATPPRRWPWVLGALFVSQTAAMALIGILPGRSLGFAVANLAEAVTCASIGIKVLGGRGNSPTTFGHIVGLFAAAIAGSAAGTLIAFPFRSEPSLAELAWWFLSSVLGIIAGTPALLYLRQALGLGDQNVRFWRPDMWPMFCLVVLSLFVLAMLILPQPYVVLMPLLIVAIVFAVVRYGQLAGACGVIAYGVAGTTLSVGGQSPAAFLDMEPASAGLVLQALMLLMLATALPIAAMLITRDRLQAQLRAQNAELHDNLTMLSLAESLAGIGRWRYDIPTGRQHWSSKMLELNGLPGELAPDPGDIRELLPDGGERLFSQLAEHRDDREPYNFEYSVRPDGGEERMLRVHVTNEFDQAGERTALFAVAMDVTEQVRREHSLRQARERAIELAAEAQKLAMTDPLTGLANRRATFDWLRQLMPAAIEEDEPLTVLLFDLDHFKRINDSHGHQTGDEVLKEVARIARAEVRAEDLVGRIGGEEFVCLLSLDEQAASKLAERLRHAIAVGAGAGGLPLATISVGLALCREGDTPERVLARADAALYEAKEAGRNQVRRAA